jgi:hypothetical protein
MRNRLQIGVAVLGVLCGVATAQQGGTINSLSVNPRQNLELTNSTGTQSGQPSDSVPGSESQENGLVPVTSNMVGSGSNGNLNQGASTASSSASTSKSDEGAQNTPAPRKRSALNSKPQR